VVVCGGQHGGISALKQHTCGCAMQASDQCCCSPRTTPQGQRTGRPARNSTPNAAPVGVEVLAQRFCVAGVEQVAVAHHEHEGQAGRVALAQWRQELGRRAHAARLGQIPATDVCRRVRNVSQDVEVCSCWAHHLVEGLSANSPNKSRFML